MAKKRNRRGGIVGAAGNAVSADLVCAAKDIPQDGGTPDEVSEVELNLTERTIRWLAVKARHAENEMSEMLLDAARPLIRARAAKYEEDAKDAKVAKTSETSGRVQKRPLVALETPACPDELSSSEGLGTVTRVLRQLVKCPELLSSKACKPLRAALHPLVEGQLQEEKASPAFRVGCMLGQRARWPEALKLLSEMRALDAGHRPKLGSFQRWVRELDVAEGTAAELAMLDAIMRLAIGLPPGKMQSSGSLLRVPPWQPARAPLVEVSKATTPEAKADEKEEGEEEKASPAARLCQLIAARRSEVAKVATRGSWSVLAHEAAHARKPPNHFDLDIYMCSPEALPLNSPPVGAVTRHEVPGVEGACVLSGVLSDAECKELCSLSEAIGYRPDVPLSSALDERSHNVVIMASEQQNRAIFSRVKDLLPQELCGERLLGLNRRWRLYRYAVGNLYRKHLDGAWPASGVREGPRGSLEYLYDAHGGCRSRLTFIVYLNDDFDGGNTTFFVPRLSAEGELEERPVRPRAGCVTFFPHGDTGVPLLHEGSSVARGQKYILRTDVLYEAVVRPEEAQRAARLRGLARQLGGLGGHDLVKSQDEDVYQKGREPRRAEQMRKVVKRNLKGGTSGQKDSRGKKSNKRKKKRQQQQQEDNQAPNVSVPGKKSTRKKDARAAAKLKMVGRLKTGKKAP